MKSGEQRRLAIFDVKQRPLGAVPYQRLPLKLVLGVPV